MPVAWMIDELAHAGHEHLDPASVAGYERKQGGVPDEAAAADVEALRRHGLDATSTVVDLGAGTGRFAVAAAAHFGRVVAVDVSPAMLRALHARVTEAGCGNVEVVQGGFLSYEHAAARADAVCARNALHQLPDFFKALALARVASFLRPGGLLRLRDLVFDFAPHEAAEVLGRWFDGAADDAATGYTREDLAEHVRTEHSTFRWLLEPMLEAAGFEIVEAGFRAAVYGAYTCVRR